MGLSGIGVGIDRIAEGNILEGGVVLPVSDKALIVLIGLVVLLIAAEALVILIGLVVLLVTAEALPVLRRWVIHSALTIGIRCV